MLVWDIFFNLSSYFFPLKLWQSSITSIFTQEYTSSLHNITLKERHRFIWPSRKIINLYNPSCNVEMSLNLTFPSMHIATWHSCKNHVMLQNSFLFYILNNFITSLCYALWDDIIMWLNIAPWFDILSYPHITILHSCRKLVILQNSFLLHIEMNKSKIWMLQWDFFFNSSSSFFPLKLLQYFITFLFTQEYNSSSCNKTLKEIN